MTAFLNDTFSGSGSADGHVPETTFGGLVWFSDTGFNPADLASGNLVRSGSEVTGAVGNATLGAATTYGTPDTFDGSFTFTRLSGDSDALTRLAVGLIIEVSDSVLSFELWADSDGTTMTWYSFVNGAYATAYTTPTVGTTYTCDFSISDGAQTFTIFGVTASGTETYGVPGRGVQNVDLSVGSRHGIGGLTFATVTTDGLDVTLPAFTGAAYGGGTAQLTLPKFTLSTIKVETGNAAMELPALTLEAFGGASASLSLPHFTLQATGAEIPPEFVGTFQPMTLSAYGGANAYLSFPAPTLSASATFWGKGEAALKLPAPSLSATGSTSAVGKAALTLPPVAMLAGFGGAVLSVNISGFTLTATGTGGGVGRANLALPLFELVASGTAQNHGGANLDLPAFAMVPNGKALLILPGFQLTAIGTAVITATYEAYAVNLNPSGENPVNEVTHYTNFPFTQVIRYKNSYFGVAADGLYLLEGTTDHASPAPAPIRFNWKTAQTDFKTALEKTVVSAYFGGTMGPNDTVTLYAGNKTSQAYAFTTPRGNDIQNHRQKFGRGIKARYFAIGVSGSGPLELDGVEFNLNTLTRRI